MSVYDRENRNVLRRIGAVWRPQVTAQLWREPAGRSIPRRRIPEAVNVRLPTACGSTNDQYVKWSEPEESSRRRDGMSEIRYYHLFSGKRHCIHFYVCVEFWRIVNISDDFGRINFIAYEHEQKRLLWDAGQNNTDTPFNLATSISLKAEQFCRLRLFWPFFIAHAQKWLFVSFW